MFTGCLVVFDWCLGLISLTRGGRFTFGFDSFDLGLVGVCLLPLAWLVGFCWGLLVVVLFLGFVTRWWVGGLLCNLLFIF